MQEKSRLSQGSQLNHLSNVGDFQLQHDRHEDYRSNCHYPGKKWIIYSGNSRKAQSRGRDLMGFKQARGTSSLVLLLCKTTSQDEILPSMGHFWGKINTLRERMWAKDTTDEQQGVLKTSASIYWKCPASFCRELCQERATSSPKNSHFYQFCSGKDSLGQGLIVEATRDHFTGWGSALTPLHRAQ